MSFFNNKNFKQKNFLWCIELTNAKFDLNLLQKKKQIIIYSRPGS
jgi:hypothetical protein